MNYKKKLTPMMQQYFDVKKQYPDALLFFRVGDFFESFYEDAKTVARELQLTLTARDKKEANPIPLAGVPHHAIENYLVKLVKKGYKVAICDQVEDPKKAKGLVKRDIVKIITPGTVSLENAIDTRSNNYVVSLHKDNSDKYGIAMMDVNTGEFQLSELTSDNLIQELNKINPSEIIVSISYNNDIDKSLRKKYINITNNLLITPIEDYFFIYETCHRDLLEHFNVKSLDGFGIAKYKTGIVAAGALLNYVKDTQRADMEHVNKINYYNPFDYMVLDTTTIQNLELVRTLHENKRDGSLLSLLDNTVTSMGARLLKKWLLNPLMNRDDIYQRYDSIEEFYNDNILLTDTREILKSIYDIDRLISRLGCNNANARDLLSLSGSLEKVLELNKTVNKTKSSLIKEFSLYINNVIGKINAIIDLINESIYEEPPLILRDGKLIKTGYNPEVDELREISVNGKKWIASLQKTEREKTGITTLKVGYNKVFGYYIDVSKANTGKVPEHYIRKQTLVNNERYITPELKEMENKILNASEKLTELEYDIFIEIRNKITQYIPDLINISRLVSRIDTITNLAYIAKRYNFNRPVITDERFIKIKNGRHPVVELLLKDKEFVPNDAYLAGADDRFIILTGPNMAGKSTYIRQVAIIILMAQIGSFIPADESELCIVDRIFTRVGASDNLIYGQSTFMVEMNETANIINNATANSLIILDEIGRGTSTYDGMSIAWSVAEYILNLKRIGAFTLFATHYHELTQLSGKYEGIKNYSVAVREWNDEIIFLHKIIPGKSDRSYGIQVARLAGLPNEIIDRAKDILFHLEETTTVSDRVNDLVEKSNEDLQLKMFTYSNDKEREKLEEIKDILTSVDVNNITPMQAISILDSLKNKLDIST